MVILVAMLVVILMAILVAMLAIMMMILVVMLELIPLVVLVVFASLSRIRFFGSKKSLHDDSRGNAGGDSRGDSGGDADNYDDDSGGDAGANSTSMKPLTNKCSFLCNVLLRPLILFARSPKTAVSGTLACDNICWRSYASKL